MMEIGPRAFGALQQESERAFVVKLGTVLRTEVPSLAHEPEPEFSRQVESIIRRARDFGLESEQSIGAYAMTAGMLGLDFPDHFAGARQILESSQDEDSKAELLEHFTLAVFEALER